jgi:N-methylhydantoinase B
MEEATVIRAPAGMTGVVYNHCDRVPPRGFAGGLPGGAGLIAVYRGTNALDLYSQGKFPSLDEVDGRFEEWGSIADVQVAPGDVVIMSGGGGGGLGDPLLRAPGIVEVDLREQRVAPETASSVYGVVFDENGVDLPATGARREEIRRERVRAAGGDVKGLVAPSEDGVVGSSVVVDGDQWRCAHCQHELGSADENWRDAALVSEQNVVDALGSRKQRIRPRVEEPAVVERDLICPGCGSLLSADVALSGDPPAAAPHERRTAVSGAA